MVEPSCPAYIIHAPGDFRSRLVQTLDQTHFMVTISDDGDDVDRAMKDRKFNVVLVGLDLRDGSGVKALEYLRAQRDTIPCGVIILSEPTPEVRAYASWASETLLKPVDPAYVARRARAYCGC